MRKIRVRAFNQIEKTKTVVLFFGNRAKNLGVVIVSGTGVPPV
jgi:hypothetical protein